MLDRNLADIVMQGSQMAWGVAGQKGFQGEELPMWDQTSESNENAEFIVHFRTGFCPDLASGNCPKGKSPSVPQQCFHFHYHSQRRRPVVDLETGRLRYWDFMCPTVSQGGQCSLGDVCQLAHTAHEISYHAAKYKTKLCKPRQCRGRDICCFAHGPTELRVHAADLYSVWRLCRATVVPPSPFPARAVSQAQVPEGLVELGDDPMPILRSKQRFCCSFPNVAQCRRGELCAFAHSREEIQTRVFSEEEEGQKSSALTDEFFIHKFKTAWCPIGAQHDWQTCVYAHNYQDARRPPDVGYGPRPCAYWKDSDHNSEYEERCPLGYRCPYAHGAKEQLYHPSCFKTAVCQEWRVASCPRGSLCAFLHKLFDTNVRGAAEITADYRVPLSQKSVAQHLPTDFKSPPFQGCDNHSFKTSVSMESSSGSSLTRESTCTSIETTETDEFLSVSVSCVSLQSATSSGLEILKFYDHKKKLSVPAALTCSLLTDPEHTIPNFTSRFDEDSSTWWCADGGWDANVSPMSDCSTMSSQSNVFTKMWTHAPNVMEFESEELWYVKEFPTRNGFIHYTQDDEDGNDTQRIPTRPRSFSF